MSTKKQNNPLYHEEIPGKEANDSRTAVQMLNLKSGNPKSLSMNKWMYTFPLVLIITMVIGSCTKDEETQYLIDAPLQEYFDRFQAEAALRNIVIDYQAMMISGDIRIIGAQNVIGQCGHTEKEPNVVIVDKFYWDSADDLEREFLVFHELGHCALDRGHLDDSDGQGNCISIMTSGTGLCHIEYTAATRTALLEELFTP